MLSLNFPTTPSPLHARHEGGAPSKKPSLLERFSISWEKLIFISNIAMLTAGVAYGFFMSLPKLIIGLGLYGIYYCMLHAKAKNSDSSSETVQNLKTQLNLANLKAQSFNEKLNASASARSAREDVEQDAQTLEAKIARYQKEKTRYEREARIARADRDTALQELAAAKRRR